MKRLPETSATLTESERKDMLGSLTTKQRQWFEEWRVSLDPDRASREVYDASTAATRYNITSRNRHHDKLSQLMADHFEQNIMGPAEAVARLTRLAMFDTARFYEQFESGELEIDWHAVATAPTGLVKVTSTRDVNGETIKVQLDPGPAVDALKKIIDVYKNAGVPVRKLLQLNMQFNQSNLARKYGNNAGMNEWWEDEDWEDANFFDRINNDLERKQEIRQRYGLDENGKVPDPVETRSADE